ncbi:hypothetical protein CMV_019716 [Castanea mollissima]|uniref:Uncharacterized protein n=1 Tax=Castanea mollissima TaxID=60419 RepID=A0A8J4VND7_9ROSI|nr:hypothetical protein CMV_019716 [Castanea mollissima]
MTSLKHLDLSYNNFNSSIPNWLYSFSHLEFLNLAHNNLQGTISSAIGNLTSAISIDLSENELGGKLPRSLGNLCNLREITLSSNKWSQEISEILESLSGCLSDRLEILDLSYSQLHGQLTDELGGKRKKLQNDTHCGLLNLDCNRSLLCMLQKVAPVHAFQEATKISSKFYDEIKIIDSIAALIGWQRLSKVFIGFIWASQFLHHHFLILNLENNEPTLVREIRDVPCCPVIRDTKLCQK